MTKLPLSALAEALNTRFPLTTGGRVNIRQLNGRDFLFLGEYIILGGTEAQAVAALEHLPPVDRPTAAKLVGKSIWSIRQAVVLGKLHMVSPDPPYRIALTELDRWAAIPPRRGNFNRGPRPDQRGKKRPDVAARNRARTGVKHAK